MHDTEDRRGTEVRSAPNDGAYAITVLFELEEGVFGEFYRLVSDNARTSVAVEEGCLRFDVLTGLDAGRETDVFLYELYIDRAAFDAHVASDHFRSFDAMTRTMVRRKTIASFEAAENAKPGPRV